LVIRSEISATDQSDKYPGFLGPCLVQPVISGNNLFFKIETGRLEGGQLIEPPEYLVEILMIPVEELVDREEPLIDPHGSGKIVNRTGAKLVRQVFRLLGREQDIEFRPGRLLSRRRYRYFQRRRWWWWWWRRMERHPLF